MVAPFLPEKEKVAAIRDELPATSAGIYLDTATAGPLPVSADLAMREWSERDLRLGRIALDADAEFADRADEARATLAAVLVAPIERVRLAPSVGSGLRDAVARWSWRRGERLVLASSLEPAVRGELAALAASVGAELVVLDLPSGDDADDIVGAVDGSGRDARVVVLPHVSPVDGAVAPVSAVAERLRAAGAHLAIDGSLAVGAVAVDVPRSGAAIYATAGDRWLCGPSGTAAVYTGGDQEHEPSDEDRAAEAAALHRPAVVGLARSAGWLAMQVGLEWAFTRTRRLLDVVASGLGDIRGLSFAAPRGATAATLAFRVEGWPADRLREELGRRVFALVGTAGPADAVRISVGCWNTEDELLAFVAGVADLARSTPEEAARRRPMISVVGGDGR